MLKGLAFVLFSVLSVGNTDVTTSPEYLQISEETAFKWVKGKYCAADRGVLLVFKDAKRDSVAKSLVKVRFDAISIKSMPFGAYDPGIDLYLGVSGRRLLKQSYKADWKLAKFRQRSLPVSLTIVNADPEADTLEDLTLKFYFRQLGAGRADTEAEFEFDKLPVSN